MTGILGNLFPDKDPRQDGKEMKKMSKEIKLKKAVLDSIIMLLTAMEFSQEESAIGSDISIAITYLKSAEAVYKEWSK
jgi:hypothetical protein